MAYAARRMSLLRALGRRLLILGRRPPDDGRTVDADDDWRLARPAAIRRALERASARPSGNWYVLDASRTIGKQPRRYVVDGMELVAWRCDGAIVVAPNACPHMGASLADGCVEDGALVCPWHGLKLRREGHGAWRPFATHDDGVFTWVRLGPAIPSLPAPILAPRPRQHLTGIIARDAKCEPADVIANRLDPWHGAHLHDYSFARLRVLSDDGDTLRVRVAFRIAGPLCVECDCTFHSPEPRTVVMTIVDGEGIGSVVETHATPTEKGVTRILEATLAASPRPGFRHVLPLQPLIRPFIERSAARLWIDDAAYAERVAWLRQQAAEGEDQLALVASRGTPQK
jgi:hypothetical protein